MSKNIYALIVGVIAILGAAVFAVILIKNKISGKKEEDIDDIDAVDDEELEHFFNEDEENSNEAEDSDDSDE